MDISDWRAQLPPESRHRIVNKIMDTLKRHLPVSDQEGLHELRKIAQRFEEKIYAVATSQSDYLRKISLKMLTMETKSQNPMANSMPSSPGLGMQSQLHNLGQSHPINLANQAQSRQQLLSQNIQSNITPSGVPSSAGVAPRLTPVSKVGQTPIQNVGPQQNISGQNSVGNTIGQGYFCQFSETNALKAAGSSAAATATDTEFTVSLPTAYKGEAPASIN